MLKYITYCATARQRMSVKNPTTQHYRYTQTHTSAHTHTRTLSVRRLLRAPVIEDVFIGVYVYVCVCVYLLRGMYVLQSAERALECGL